MKKYVLVLVALAGGISGCHTKDVPAKVIDWQGHRGARGVFPENTWPAFQYALEQDMHTLEMDVVLTGDTQVVLSHEPFLSHEICLDTSGGPISQEDEEQYNIYRMTYAELQQYDCGSKPHPRFPNQQKSKLGKPLLTGIITQAEAFKREKPVYYSIEVKSRPDRDSIYYPSVEFYTDEVVNVISRAGIFSRTTLQSFDKRCLKYAHTVYPDLNLALLVEGNANYTQELEELGFKPAIYSCEFSLVNKRLVEYCHHENILLIPWTVNSVEEAKKLVDMGVDGVITDYPEISKAFYP
ncbi:MAG TPA: glycerophosphodiester phosphodiesterase [Cryomorphaceae bacterium]|nr:glycerophosphodiester phosphodiesterase [Cryomorphaceae bacterium]